MNRFYISLKHMTLVLLILLVAYGHSLIASPCPGASGDIPQNNTLTFKNTGSGTMTITNTFIGGSISIAAGVSGNLTCSGGSPVEFFYSGGTAVDVTSTANGGTYYAATLSGGFITIPAAVLQENYWGTESPQKTYSSGCTGLTYKLGAGAYQDIVLAANTYYDFSWNSTAGTTTNGINGYKGSIVSGGAGSSGFDGSFQFNTMSAWFSGTTAPTIRVLAKRTNGSWDCNRWATLTINVSQPSGPSGGTKAPNVSSTCAGTGVSYSSPTAGTRGEGCTDDYIWLINSTSQGAYTLGSTVGTVVTAGNTINIQGRRANCTGSGCTGTAYTTLASWTVVAQPTGPTGGIKSPNLSNICAGTSVSFSSPTAGSGGIGCGDDYIWLINGISQGAYTLGNSVGSGATAGQVITIQGRRSNCSANTGCSGNYATLATWTVVAQPGAPSGGTKSPNLTNICAGTNVSFSSPTAGTGGTGCTDDYIWLIDGVSQGAYTLGSSVGSSATATQVISIQGRRANCTSGAGCTGTSYTTLASWTVVAQPGVPSGGTKSPNLSNICAGTSVSYSSPTSGTGGTGCSDDYIWLINGVSQGAYTLGSSVGSGATATQVITIQGRRANCTSGAGCTGTSYTTLASWIVDAAPTATPNSTVFTCDGTAELNATAITSGATIKWSYVSGPVNPTGTSTSNPLTVTFTSAGTGVYDLLVSKGACTDVNVGTVSLVLPTTSSTTIASTASCGYCIVKDGNTRSFYNSSGEIIATIEDDPFVTPDELALTEVCTRQDGSVQTITDNLGNQQPYLQRQWTVTPTTSTNAFITFYFTNAELTALQTAATGTVYQFSGYGLFVTKYPGGSNGSFTSPGSAGGVNVPASFSSYGSNHKVEVAVSSYSTFYIHPALFPFAPLPVELTSFTGWNQGVTNKLEWVTASEENTNRFEIEKSVNSLTWENIGSKSAAGNSSQTIIYNFTDNNPVVGNNYYRLKIFDNDETFAYSNVINIPINDAVLDGFVNIYPNPTNGIFNVEIQATSSYDSKLLVYDVIGKKLFEKSAIISKGLNTLQLDFGIFANGTYILQFIDFTGKLHTSKVVKN